ncbi:MAG: hypothetical protein FD167_2317, partial [bacterium]
MDDKLFAALVSAVASIVAVIIGYFINRKNQSDLEFTKNENNRLLTQLNTKLTQETQEKQSLLSAKNQETLALLTTKLSEITAEKNA